MLYQTGANATFFPARQLTPPEFYVFLAPIPSDNALAMPLSASPVTLEFIRPLAGKGPDLRPIRAVPPMSEVLPSRVEESDGGR
jgi:hypothetical protein